MAGTSISSQLQAIKTVLNASNDPEPGKKRPLTRPSILFDAKAAADIDLDTIFNIALSGLEVLIAMEERFGKYKSDLFSYQSKELDRELVGQEENKLINASISSYLRLLSGYLELHSALKTLEYLIRRYKVHVYNTEDLILCSLPYHDTHVFVQIVQLISAGNSRWKFLDGVKASGARLPREVIVQQCIRDMGVLESICNYATPIKKSQPSKNVIGFCTAVIFEVLGLVTVDSDTVKRILPYVSSGLQPGARGQDQKAGALMIVSLLAQKAALAPNVVKSLLHLVADLARAEAKDIGDLQWLRMSFMTLVSIIQLQSVELIPKKTVNVLNEIRDVLEILSGLTKDFNIDKFLAVFQDSLLEYSATDGLCHRTLLSMIETVPMKDYVSRMVIRLLSMRINISQGKRNLLSSESGSQGKEILVFICDKYPNEFREAFFSFLKETNMSKKVNSTYDLLCKILDEHLDSSQEIHDPKIFFALEHAEAEIRRAAILGLDVVNILKEKTAGSKKFDAIQDALIRRLYDDDLNVVLAVLNLKNLYQILNSPHLMEALQYVLRRCIEILLSSKFVEEKYPHIYWTPCAAHCIDLMLEEIFIAPHLKRTLEKAIAVNTYIYNRTLLLNMMRDFTGQKDMVRPAKTRFATAFLTLSCFKTHKKNLRKMFTSHEWNISQYSKNAGGHQVASTILLSSFWKNIDIAVKFGGPLLHVLRLVDGERRPPMGYIYEAMDIAKETIAQSFNNKETKYKDAFKIIDERWNIQLHRPLHAAGHYLNPALYYDNPAVENDAEVISGLMSCITKLASDEEEEMQIHKELPIYRNAQGIFGYPMAKKMRKTQSPGSLANTSPPSDAALSCLLQVITNFKDQEQYATTLATTIFPLLPIRPKTQKLNLKALELAKEIKWPFYENIVTLPGPNKKLDHLHITSINMENISKLAETFSLRPEEYMPWLVKCCNSHEISKALFFLILLQSLEMLKMDAGPFFVFFDSCLRIIKNEWEMLVSMGISAEQTKKRILDGDCKGLLEDLLDTDIKDLNAEILAYLFLRLLKAFIARVPEDVASDMKCIPYTTLKDLFVFFACHSKDAFKEHLNLLTKCKISLTRIMLELFTEEGIPDAAQIESLHSFSNMCSQLDQGSVLQLLFPSVLVPLSSDNQNVRVAAMSCMKELFDSWSPINSNGNNGAGGHFLRDLLCLIIQQKKMILSDKNLLATFFTSLLNSSSQSLLMQQAIGESIGDCTKYDILVFMVSHALGLPAHAKLKVLSLIRGVGSKLMSIPGVRSLLNDLLEGRRQYYLGVGKLCHKLSQSEVDTLCLLLESCTRPNSSSEVHDLGDFILKALWVNGSEDSAVLEPCMTILRNLSSSLYGDMKSEIQELIFRNLLVLYRSANGDIRNASRDTLLRLNLNCSIVGRVLDSILDMKIGSVGSVHGKKQKKSAKLQNPYLFGEATQNTESTHSLLSAFLEVLLIKKDIDNRTSLVGPLFKLLHMIFTDVECMHKSADQDKSSIASSDSPRAVSDTTAYIQQTLLLTVEDISGSIGNDIPQKDINHNFDLPLLVSCACSSRDAITRNHAFSLITALVKIIPDKVLDHFLDILTAIGECTVTQWDSYSQRVFEGLISAIVPCWLSRNNNTDELLQIFVNILPQVAEHRRFTIIGHLLRTLGEAQSLGPMLFLLFRSLTSRKNEPGLLVNKHSFDHLMFVITKQWEYEFSVLLCEQYSCTIWLPSLILALQKILNDSSSVDTCMQMLVAMQFVSDKLRDPKLSNKLELDEDDIQAMVGELMEQLVYHLQMVDFKEKHNGVPASIKSELKEYIRAVLRTLTKDLPPSTYFKVITKLILHGDRNVRKKALGLLCEAVKDLATNTKLEKKGSTSSLRSLWLHLNEDSLESFENLCLEILKLLDTRDDASHTSSKLAAISALEVLANSFPSHDRVFGMCLGTVCRKICSDNPALSSHCLRATGALINALGQRALPELPSVMECMLRKSRDVSLVDVETERTADGATISTNSVDSLFMSILVILEATVDKLAGFLNPYLGDILKLIVLHPLSVGFSVVKLKSRADVVRKLITEKVPVRLLLPQVLSMYSDAVKSGESSLSVVFEMLGNLVASMDRRSIGVYHAKIFDLCLLALDLRHENPSSVQNIDVVEQYVITAVVTLTMKLTEAMFRPLFIKTIEWSGLSVEGDENTHGKADSRAISFYSLVNKLADSHRSLFIPYFKYLLDVCARGLVDSEVDTGETQKKKKKAKLYNNTQDRDGVLSLQVWHRRALILSSLHKCFLYDTGNSKFLDSSKFQVLLKPLVSQLVVEPPVFIENHPNVPSVKEVDDILVACITQMAVTAGSDLLWKSLNHEVLMQTRSEKIRARILGLRIVKRLLDNLREEYLVFLPEIIPFLGELLEDIELPIKALTQEILKEMETMSGESLRQYL